MATGNDSRAPALRIDHNQSDPAVGPPSRLARFRTTDARQDGTLGSLIEGEIIPRLLMAHRADCADSLPGGDGKASVTSAIDGAEAARFASLPLHLEAEELLGEVETFLARGVSIEAVFVELLAPSARRLGQLWEEDACDFVDVTMGLWRLQEVMREITLRMPTNGRTYKSPPTALFAPIPGDQHSFGSLMVEEVFSRAGWQSEVVFEPKRRELLGIIAERNFDLIGLTISCDCPSGTVAELISAIRGASRHPAMRIIIGGRAINADPDVAAQVGADGTASDARSALALAERLVMGTSLSVGCG